MPELRSHPLHSLILHSRRATIGARFGLDRKDAFMKHARIHSLAPILPVALFALLAGRADSPKFQAREGVVVKRTLEMKGTRDLQSQAMELGDERQVNPNAFLHIDLGWKHVVKDEYVKCTDERVDHLKRTYDSLEKSRTEKSKDQAGAEKTNEVKETCDLEGNSVNFVWNADKKEYAKSFEDKGDEALLADLELDMDYREFLPAPDAEVGAKWERDLADLKVYLLRPGGDLPFHAEKPPRPLDTRMRAIVWDATKGKVEFELKPSTETDGRKLAHIHFKGQNTVDASAEAESGEPGPSRLAMADSQTFEGELVWDLAAGRAHGIEWNAKGTMVLKVSLPVKSKEGEDLTLIQAFTFATEYDYTGSFDVE